MRPSRSELDTPGRFLAEAYACSFILGETTTARWQRPPGRQRETSAVPVALSSSGFACRSLAYPPHTRQLPRHHPPHRAAVQVHHAPVQGGMRNDHPAATPVAGCVRPGSRRRIAHAELLHQGQGNAALLQVRGELLRQVWARWGGLTRRRWACRWRLSWPLPGAAAVPAAGGLQALGRPPGAAVSIARSRVVRRMRKPWA